jgi:hypothetical protein
MPEFFEVEDARDPKIQYRAVADLLFPGGTDRKQRLIPFVGAGASLGPDQLAGETQIEYPTADQLAAVIAALKLSGRAALFIELAARLAATIQAGEHGAPPDSPSSDPVAVARTAKYPPSAAALAAALASESAFDGFERPRRRVAALLHAKDAELLALLRWIAELTEIGPSVPPLLSVASYYEFTLQRGQLWRELRGIFENKQTPTRTHWLLARAAAHHIARRPWKDYLIITTNYDRLTEIALEKAGVPHCVLSVANADQHVDVRFSSDMQQHLELNDADFALLKVEHANKYPNNFTLDLDRKVAIVYKLHGCLYPEVPERDSLILSDEDYIRYLMKMHDASGMIPSEITTLTELPAFLFLGYSFSDWNVRAMYKTVVKRRTAPNQQAVRDFAVVRDFSSYEGAYCREDNGRIHLLVTDLRRFIRRIMQHAPPRPRPAADAAPARHVSAG